MPIPVIETLEALICAPDKMVLPDPEIVRIPDPRFSVLAAVTEPLPAMVSPPPAFTMLPLKETFPGPVTVSGLDPEAVTVPLNTVGPVDETATVAPAFRAPLKVVAPLLTKTFPEVEAAAPKVVVPVFVTVMEEEPVEPWLKFTVPWPPAVTGPLNVSVCKFTTPEEFVVRLPLPPTWPVNVVLPAPATVSPKLPVDIGLPRVSVPLALEIVAAPVRLIWSLRVLFPETFWIAPAPATPDPAIVSPLSLTETLF